MRHGAHTRTTAWLNRWILLQELPGHAHAQPIGRPCSTWVWHAMKGVMGMRVKLGQNFHNLGWDWPVLATRRGSGFALSLPSF